jgi:inhibitor of cysteine peptidase
MRLRWLFATILRVAILTPAAFSLGAEAIEADVQVLVLREQDAGKIVDVPVGGVAEIRLSENPTTGYRWAIAQFSGKICAIIHDEFIPPVSNALGAGGEHVWRLRAMAPGDCEIELVYARSSGNADQRIYRVRLHVP